MVITELGGFVFLYEVWAKATGHRTWTEMTADRDMRALPCWVFAAWLVIHLLRARRV